MDPILGICTDCYQEIEFRGGARRVECDRCGTVVDLDELEAEWALLDELRAAVKSKLDPDAVKRLRQLAARAWENKARATTLTHRSKLARAGLAVDIETEVETAQKVFNAILSEERFDEVLDYADFHFIADVWLREFIDDGYDAEVVW